MDEVRLWKIKESQLEDLQKQEVKRCYDKIITLGEKNGLKIPTFTGCWYNKKKYALSALFGCY